MGFPCIHWFHIGCFSKLFLTGKILRVLSKNPATATWKSTLEQVSSFLLFETSKMFSKFSGFQTKQISATCPPWSRFSISVFFFGKGKIPHVFTPCDGCETLMAWCCWRWRWFFLHLTSCCCNTEIQGGEGEVQRGTESSWSLQTEEVF